MRQNSKPNTRESKRLARLKYAERHIDNWWKWSYEARNKIKFKELVAIQDKYNIKCYG
jgi:hypothetical protein|tara:strand:- start:341 stop:514 length:174 start_codon:yes stop_codon:yes gene_type:complete